MVKLAKVKEKGRGGVKEREEERKEIINMVRVYLVSAPESKKETSTARQLMCHPRE